ncbi:hypothetical protein BaRGS_00015141 [Batillaria attramentaria]|uniref:Arrestin C-terminal-like domain-containing protein n=1 Tax=Batillaria attramentaria TaxID=370345 RepID=A0ABD0L3B8_9CAEN
MSVEDLILHFEYDENREKQFYIPGETIRGTILLHLRMGLRVRSMSLLILGGAAVSWEVQGKVKMYSAREEYLQGSKLLLDSGVEDSLLMDRGVHEFTFQYLLPTNLPSSFAGVYGSVTYVAKVVLEPEDGSATTITSEPFMVLRRPPLPPHTFSDWEMKKSKSLFGLCTTGQIKLYCRISRTAAIPGEVIYVNAEVSNWSPRGITLIQAAVIMESTYHARNTDSKNNKIVFRQILNKRWRNVQLAVPPYLADSGLEECSIIDVKYLFEFRVQIEGRDDLVVQTPLYVGGHPIGYMNESARGYRRMDLDGFSLANNELPWYGGGMGTMSETVDGDFFDLR